MEKLESNVRNLRLNRIKVLSKKNQVVMRIYDKTEYYSISKKNKIKILKTRYKVC